MFNENEVRAAAGLTMVIGAVAFSYAYFDAELRAAPGRHDACSSSSSSIRLTLGLRYSPMGVVARAMTRGHPPEWVSAKPKRFAWTLGLGMSFAMVIITNSGIRGMLPRTICLICLTLMWMESVLGRVPGLQDPRPAGATRLDDARTPPSRSAPTAPASCPCERAGA